MNPAAKPERDREIIRLHVEDGLKFSEIARRYLISRQRVHQIVVAAGGPSLTRERWEMQRATRNLFRAIANAAWHEKTRAHGTLRRYRLGCSCEQCRAANRAQVRSLKGKPPPSHGVSGYLHYRCRCDICRSAAMEKFKLRAPVYARVQHALKTGVLVRPEACEECGTVGRVHGHHEDYDKPLDVEWLCPGCHGRKRAPHRQREAA